MSPGMHEVPGGAMALAGGFRACTGEFFALAVPVPRQPDSAV
jgi:hypothetical protein